MVAATAEQGGRRIGMVAVSAGGRRLAERIAAVLPGASLIAEQRDLGPVLRQRWPEYHGFVMVMAAGAVVRLIAPLLKDKRTDPCVVVLDEAGRYCVSLLSGHLGGGNALAREVAALVGGQAVITTASDVLGHTAVDLWIKGQGLVVEDARQLTRVSARLVNNGTLRLCSELPVAGLPPDFTLVDNPDEADCMVSNRAAGCPAGVLLLIPRNLVVGIGCNRGTSSGQIEAALREGFASHGLSLSAIRNLATIDLKQDEAGLLAFAQARGLAIEFYSKDELNSVAGVDRSEAVLRATGAQSVAEPAALLSSGSDNLLVRKMKWKDVTMAIAEAPSTLSAPVPAA